MANESLEQWSIRQTGRQLIIELCQFVLLLRLVTLVFIIFGPLMPSRPIEVFALATIALTAVIGTYAMHRLVDSASAHPLIVGVDVAIAAMGLFVSHASPLFVVLSIFSALLIGLLNRGVSAALLLIVLVLAFLAPSSAREGDVSTVEIISRPALYLVAYGGGRVVAQRVGLLTERSLAMGNQVASLVERSRMAREMHDGVVKTLHGIALSAEALGRTEGLSAPLKMKFESFSRAAEFGVQQAREALVELRSDQDDRPVVVVVEDIVTRWSSRARINATFTATTVADVDGYVRNEILACLREALDNVAEHSEASTVAVGLAGSPHHVTLTIEDDGKGVDSRRLGSAVRQGHFGVQGMKERAAAVGGTCEIQSSSETGTTIRLSFPHGGARYDVGDPARND